MHIHTRLVPFLRWALMPWARNQERSTPSSSSGVRPSYDKSGKISGCWRFLSDFDSVVRSSSDIVAWQHTTWSWVYLWRHNDWATCSVDCFTAHGAICQRSYRSSRLYLVSIWPAGGLLTWPMFSWYAQKALWVHTKQEIETQRNCAFLLWN